MFAKKIVKSHEDAENIVQEVFIRIWEKHSELNENLSIDPFIFTITYRISISQIRKKASEKSFLDKWYRKTRNEIQSVNDAEHREIYELTNKLIEQIPERCRQVFIMSRDKGLTYKEISNELGISVSTVEKRMITALKFLRQHQQDLMAI